MTIELDISLGAAERMAAMECLERRGYLELAGAEGALRASEDLFELVQAVVTDFPDARASLERWMSDHRAEDVRRHAARIKEKLGDKSDADVEESVQESLMIGWAIGSLVVEWDTPDGMLDAWEDHLVSREER